MSHALPSEEVPEPEIDRRRETMPWIGGAILIFIGVIFLVQNLTDLQFENWWTIFILIPAFGSLARAWQIRRAYGRWNAAARAPLFGGLVLLLVAATFLFNFDWGNIWPIFLIIAGVGALLTALDHD
jgi:hypothetical protein